MSWPVDPAAYALGLLEPEERIRAERLLREDPRFRAEVDRLQAVGSRLAALPREAWTPPPPPAAPSPAGGGGRWSRRRLALAAGAATAAAAALAAALAVVLPGGSSAPAVTVALRPVGGVAAGASGEAVVRGASMELRVEGLPPTRRGTFYELWLLDDPEHLVSLGAFRVPPSGRVDVRMPLPVAPRAYRYLDLSLEPADGDPAHSGDSLLRGPIRRA